MFALKRLSSVCLYTMSQHTFSSNSDRHTEVVLNSFKTDAKPEFMNILTRMKKDILEKCKLMLNCLNSVTDTVTA